VSFILKSIDNLFSETGNILAVDPGETCGFAWFNINGDDSIECISAGQIEWEDFLKEFYFALDLFNKRGFEVLIEDYKIRKDTISANIGKELLTVKVIGVIEWISERYGISTELQPAGMGNKFFNKERLKEMNLWVVGKEHARSAIQHGMYYLTFGRE